MSKEPGLKEIKRIFGEDSVGIDTIGGMSYVVRFDCDVGQLEDPADMIQIMLKKLSLDGEFKDIKIWADKFGIVIGSFGGMDEAGSVYFDISLRASDVEKPEVIKRLQREETGQFDHHRFQKPPAEKGEDVSPEPILWRLNQLSAETKWVIKDAPHGKIYQTVTRVKNPQGVVFKIMEAIDTKLTLPAGGSGYASIPVSALNDQNVGKLRALQGTFEEFLNPAAPEMGGPGGL